MNYKYGVYDLTGRLWAKTLTALRAAKLVRDLGESKGLVCIVRPL